MSLAVDISNYQGALSQAQFEAMKAEGCRTVICGTDGSPQNPIVFAQQASRARATGLDVEAYIFLYFGTSDIVARTNTKLDMIDAVGGIKRVWLDCEADSNGLDESTVVALIASARDAVQARGYEVGIYTGGWWWGPNTGNSTGFANLPLWCAQYDEVRTLESVVLFGGWAEAYRKQFTDKGTLGGVSPLDLNVERESVLVVSLADDFQRGRTEMYEAWVRETEAHLEYVKSLREAWGVR